MFFPCFPFCFVGRFLRPRDNSLKQVEASRGCRVYIRGKEEKIKRKTRQHPNEQSHILIEVDLLANIVDIRLWQAQEIIELLKPTGYFHLWCDPFDSVIFKASITKGTCPVNPIVREL
ncbi:hypothetical protein GLYMA_15G228700v4 [Glycine max]|uniref:KHDC4/BBP-like KH-domain type I domain-containing protein n=1 Tax=Glycine max TaxID=3847 RepID=A0A0R0G513_SOYBN|nr:hypothetical protein GLYMA_15G228700v4 [Glycine max]